jgi:hypothetical protein
MVRDHCGSKAGNFIKNDLSLSEMLVASELSEPFEDIGSTNSKDMGNTFRMKEVEPIL